MLSEYVCMNVSRIDIEMVSEQRAQTRGIERGSRADNACRRDAKFSCEMRSQMRHDIDRIGDD